MAKYIREDRLIEAICRGCSIPDEIGITPKVCRESSCIIMEAIREAGEKTALEIPKELTRAVQAIIKEYEEAKDLEYVRSPVSYAVYYGWRKVNRREKRRCERRAARSAEEKKS